MLEDSQCQLLFLPVKSTIWCKPVKLRRDMVYYFLKQNNLNENRSYWTAAMLLFQPAQWQSGNLLRLWEFKVSKTNIQATRAFIREAALEKVGGVVVLQRTFWTILFCIRIYLWDQNNVPMLRLRVGGTTWTGLGWLQKTQGSTKEAAEGDLMLFAG